MRLKFITSENCAMLDKNKESYVFGAGSLGKDVARYLKKWGINFKGFCVDDKYYQNSGGSLDELIRKDKNAYQLFYAVADVKRLRDFIKDDWYEEALNCTPFVRQYDILSK